MPKASRPLDGSKSIPMAAVMKALDGAGSTGWAISEQPGPGVWTFSGPNGAAPTVRSIPAQGKPASRAPPWVPSPKRLAPHRGARNRSLRLLAGKWRRPLAFPCTRSACHCPCHLNPRRSAHPTRPRMAQKRAKLFCNDTVRCLNSWPANVPSAPIGRTAMGRLTQGGARLAGLPWAGIPAHRWCARGHQCDLGWSDQSKHQRRRSCNNAHSEALLLLS
jgi:hypothetical protein